MFVRCLIAFALLAADLTYADPSYQGCKSSVALRQRYCDVSLPFAERVQSLVSNLTVEELISLVTPDPGEDFNICDTTISGIPSIGLSHYMWLTEVNTGVGSGCVVGEACATTFAGPEGIAASFNRTLWAAKAWVLSNELRAMSNSGRIRKPGSLQQNHLYIGITGFGPNLNVLRDPRFGRASELVGEDPFMIGEYGRIFAEQFGAVAPAVEGGAAGAGEGGGVSSKHPHSLSTSTSTTTAAHPTRAAFTKAALLLKHFTAYSQETDRGHASFSIPPFDMGDSYFPAFEAAMGAIGTRQSAATLPHSRRAVRRVGVEGGVEAPEGLHRVPASLPLPTRARGTSSPPGTTNASMAPSMTVPGGALLNLPSAPPAGLMCSYASINGVPSCFNSVLLKDMLRREWGHTDAVVFSDCGAIELQGGAHGGPLFTPTPPLLAAWSINNGTDVNAGDTTWRDHLPAAVAAGLVERRTIEAAASRAMLPLFRSGLFDPPSSVPWTRLGADVVGSAQHIQIREEAAAQAMVLLRSVGSALPIRPQEGVVVVGPFANAQYGLLSDYFGDDVCEGGVWSCIPTIAGAVQRANVPHKVTVVEGVGVTSNSTAGINAALAAVQNASVVILAVGIDRTVEHESLDRSAVTLPGAQPLLVANVLQAAKRSGCAVITLLVNGGPVALGALAPPHPPSRLLPPLYQSRVSDGPPSSTFPSSYALINIFNPAFGADAIARALYGENIAFGRLPYTVYPPSWTASNSISEHRLDAGDGRTYRYLKTDADAVFGEGLSAFNERGAVALSCVASTSPLVHGGRGGDESRWVGAGGALHLSIRSPQALQVRCTATPPAEEGSGGVRRASRPSTAPSSSSKMPLREGGVPTVVGVASAPSASVSASNAHRQRLRTSPRMRAEDVVVTVYLRPSEQLHASHRYPIPRRALVNFSRVTVPYVDSHTVSYADSATLQRARSGIGVDSSQSAHRVSTSSATSQPPSPSARSSAIVSFEVEVNPAQLRLTQLDGTKALVDGNYSLDVWDGGRLNFFSWQLVIAE